MAESRFQGGSVHRRYDPLQDLWVLVSPHRTARPWQGQQDTPAAQSVAAYDPGCYLCPGNARANGQKNPNYRSTHVFDNDFPALVDDDRGAGMGAEGGALGAEPVSPLLRREPVAGACKVVCFSPRHDLTLSRLPVEAIGDVLTVWQEQTALLGRRYPWVQVFENKGAQMGCSNPHPHCQIWATSMLPQVAETEDRTQRAWFSDRGTPMLVEYAQLELEQGRRIIVSNDDWVAVVPHWAVWPFEALLLPTRPLRRLIDVGAQQRRSLASIMRALLIRYDNLFQTSFPYSMGWHGAPRIDGANVDHWTLHAHYYPPLLRSAEVRKFMVGYEMLAEAQRDLLAEACAEVLRDQGQRHFLDALSSAACPGERES